MRYVLPAYINSAQNLVAYQVLKLEQKTGGSLKAVCPSFPQKKKILPPKRKNMYTSFWPDFFVMTSQNTTNILKYTLYPRRLEPFYVVSYFMKWVKTSWKDRSTYVQWFPIV